MLRSSLYTASVLLLSASALAQSNAASKVRPITSAPRDGGIYHVATGTWTRNASMANLGADRIYVNTCPTGYFSAFSGDTFIDEGRVPSPSSPQNLNSRPGCAVSYSVEGFEVAYCVDTAAVTWSWSFFDSYAPCATATGLTPVATFNLTGLPTISMGGLPLCWIVQVDVTGPPPTVTPFTLQADGDGSFGTTPDTFGWSMRNSLAGTAGSGSGPFIAGDPNTCTGYDGTRWDNGAAPNWPNNLAEDGTGMGTADQFRIEGGATTPGCYFFGGPPNPFGSFHLVLFSNACGAQPTGTPFCFGDGTGTACPCGNSGNPGRGCANSFPALGGALLSASGTAQVSADTVVLTGSGMPNSSVLYFQGTTQQNGGLGSIFGDGLRCAGGVVIRLGTKVNVGNTSQYPTGADLSVSVRGAIPAGGGTRTYQTWYRNAAAFCTPSAFNLSNGLQIQWVP